MNIYFKALSAYPIPSFPTHLTNQFDTDCSKAGFGINNNMMLPTTEGLMIKNDEMCHKMCGMK